MRYAYCLVEHLLEQHQRPEPNWSLTGKTLDWLEHAPILQIAKSMQEQYALRLKEEQERGNLMYILDTDVLIDVQRGYAPAIEWFSNLEELPSVPGFVVMELIQDSQNARQEV